MSDAVLVRFGSRVAETREFAMNHRVMLLTASNGIGIDISLGSLPFEQQMVERSSLYE